MAATVQQYGQDLDHVDLPTRFDHELALNTYLDLTAAGRGIELAASSAGSAIQGALTHFRFVIAWRPPAVLADATLYDDGRFTIRALANGSLVVTATDGTNTITSTATGVFAAGKATLAQVLWQSSGWSGTRGFSNNSNASVSPPAGHENLVPAALSFSSSGTNPSSILSTTNNVVVLRNRAGGEQTTGRVWVVGVHVNTTGTPYPSLWTYWSSFHAESIANFGTATLTPTLLGGSAAWGRMSVDALAADADDYLYFPERVLPEVHAVAAGHNPVESFDGDSISATVRGGMSRAFTLLMRSGMATLGLSRRPLAFVLQGPDDFSTTTGPFVGMAGSQANGALVQPDRALYNGGADVVPLQLLLAEADGLYSAREKLLTGDFNFRRKATPGAAADYSGLMVTFVPEGTAAQAIALADILTLATDTDTHTITLAAGATGAQMSPRYPWIAAGDEFSPFVLVSARGTGRLRWDIQASRNGSGTPPAGIAGSDRFPGNDVDVAYELAGDVPAGETLAVQRFDSNSDDIWHTIPASGNVGLDPVWWAETVPVRANEITSTGTLYTGTSAPLCYENIQAVVEPAADDAVVVFLKGMRLHGATGFTPIRPGIGGGGSEDLSDRWGAETPATYQDVLSLWLLAGTVQWDAGNRVCGVWISDGTNNGSQAAADWRGFHENVQDFYQLWGDTNADYLCYTIFPTWRRLDTGNWANYAAAVETMAGERRSVCGMSWFHQWDYATVGEMRILWDADGTHPTDAQSMAAMSRFLEAATARVFVPDATVSAPVGEAFTVDLRAFRALEADDATVAISSGDDGDDFSVAWATDGDAAAWGGGVRLSTAGAAAGTYTLNLSLAHGRTGAISTAVVVVTIEGEAETTPPEIVSASLASNGQTLTVVLSESVTATNAAGWSVSAGDGETRTLSLASGSGTSSLVFTLSLAAGAGDGVTVSYNAGAGDVEDSAGNALASVASFVVANGSTVARPSPTVTVNYGRTAYVTLTSATQLVTIAATLRVGGVVVATLDEGDFTESGAGPYTYAYSRADTDIGVASVVLSSAIDSTGLDVRSEIVSTFRVGAVGGLRGR